MRTMNSIFCGRPFKLISAIIIALSVSSPSNDTITTSVDLAAVMPGACCLTVPYSCDTTEDVAFLSEVSLALSDMSTSPVLARWYDARPGDSLLMLLRDARSSQAMGSMVYTNITALAIAWEQQETGLHPHGTCSTTTDCEIAAPRQADCALPSIDAGCRWHALTWGSLDRTIREAISALAWGVDVTPAEIESTAAIFADIIAEIQLISEGLESVSVADIAVRALEIAYGAAGPVSMRLLSASCSLVTYALHGVQYTAFSPPVVWTAKQARDMFQGVAKSPQALRARDKLYDAAVTAADKLSSVLARGDIESDALLSRAPSDLNVARNFVAFFEKKLAARGGGWAAVFAYTQDAVWAVCRFARGKFSSAIAGGMDGNRRAAEEGKMGRERVARAEVEEPLARGISEKDVGRSSLEPVVGKTGKEGTVMAKVLNFMRSMQEQAQEDAPPVGTTAHHLLYDAWI